MRTTKLLLVIGTAWLAGVSCSKSSKGGDDSSSGNGSGSGRGNRGGFGGNGGGGAGAGGTGGFFVYFAVANPPTGAEATTPTSAPATGGSTGTALGTGVNAGGFLVSCTTDAGAPQQEMGLALKLTDTSGDEYDTTLNFKNTCSDYAKVTVSQVAAGDQAVLTVNLATLAGKAYATGTTTTYTQAAAAAASGTGGFSRPQATEVAIAMTAPAAASSTGTGSGTGSSGAGSGTAAGLIDGGQ